MASIPHLLGGCDTTEKKKKKRMCVCVLLKDQLSVGGKFSVEKILSNISMQIFGHTQRRPSTMNIQNLINILCRL